LGRFLLFVTVAPFKKSLQNPVAAVYDRRWGVTAVGVWKTKETRRSQTAATTIATFAEIPLMAAWLLGRGFIIGFDKGIS